MICPRTLLIATVCAVLLTVACGTGVAAFAGLLPASEGVAVAVTATPLIDIQVESQPHIGLPRPALRHEAA